MSRRRERKKLAREIAQRRLKSIGEQSDKDEQEKEEPKEKRRSVLLYIIILILLILGLAIMFYPSISDIISKKDQVSVINKYEDKVMTLTDEQLKEQWEKAVEYNKQADKQNYENILALENDVMAYVEIPKISVKLPVYHGTSTRSLQLGLGHIDNSSLPIGGESTHCLITGHTGIAESEMFDNLVDVEVGDEFYIHVLNRQLTYRVVEIFIIDPDDTSKLTVVRGKDYCSLITCYPYAINSHRLVVRGEHVTGKDITKQSVQKVDVPDSTQRTVVIPGGQSESVTELKSQNLFLGPWGIILPSLILIIITCLLIIIRKMRKKKQEQEDMKNEPEGERDESKEE